MLHRLRFLFGLVLLLGFHSTEVGAAEYFVSTPAQITAAMLTAQPGDTLTMANGTWMNAQIVFAGNGTSAKPILLRSRGYGTVTLSGTSNLRIAGNYLVVDGLKFQNGYSPSGGVVEFRNSSSGAESNYCRLTNSGIIDYNPASTTTDYKWVSLYGKYNRVDHCYLKGKTHSGTTLVVWLSAQPNYHLIDHNYFGLRPELGVNGGETIRVGTSDWSLYDSFTTVEYNYFEECNGEIEIISNKSCGNIYRYNTFVSSQGTLTLRHGNRCRVEGNFFFGNRAPNSGGVRIIGEDHVVINNYIAGTDGSSLKTALSIMNGIPNSPLNGYYQVKRAVVAFNTFVDNRYSMNIGAGKDSSRTLPPLDCVIANNVVHSTYSPLITLTDTPINMLYQGNLFFGASLGISPVPSGISILDPRLGTAGPDGVRRILSNSPAIDASVGAYPYVVDDMEGHIRDSAKDIGADEYSTSPAIRRPLTPADVGPNTGTTSVDEMISNLPNQVKLYSAFPNPFNPSTKIEFSVPSTGYAVVKVYNVLGQEVARLHEGYTEGRRVHTVEFNASALGSGVYYSSLEFGAQRATQKMVYIR